MFSKLQTPHRHSLKHSKRISYFIGKDLFIQKVLPVVERNLLRSGLDYIRVCCYFLPKFQLPVNDKSFLSVLFGILEKNLDHKPFLERTFLKTKDCFKQDEVILCLLKYLQKTINLTTKEYFSVLFHNLSLQGIQPETMNAIQKFITICQNPKVLSNIVLSLKTNLPVQFLLKECKPQIDVTPEILTVLSEIESSSEILEYSLPFFDKYPSLVSRILLHQNQQLSPHQLQSLLNSLTHLPAKYECLLLLKLYDNAIDLFSSSPQLFYSSVCHLPPSTLSNFLEKAIFSPKIDDNSIKQFKQIVINTKINIH